MFCVLIRQFVSHQSGTIAQTIHIPKRSGKRVLTLCPSILVTVLLPLDHEVLIVINRLLISAKN
ncbi:hypothetical protein GW750_00840 [bacterium]|nr:hypothetical protein [bacterium]